MSRNTPTNSDDVIDSRDVIARIAELEGEREALVDAIAEIGDDVELTLSEGDTVPEQNADEEGQEAEHAEQRKAAEEELATWDEDYGDELKALKALEAEASGASDWTHGETLIRDSYFETYARDLAEDIGAISKDTSWPNTCIDWEEAAGELQQDYTSVEFDGVTYWIRS